MTVSETRLGVGVGVGVGVGDPAGVGESAPPLTVSCAAPCTPATMEIAALMVVVPDEAAVATPFESMVATLVADELQVTMLVTLAEELSLKFAVAVNDCAAPDAMVADDGLMVMLVSVTLEETLTVVVWPGVTVAVGAATPSTLPFLSRKTATTWKFPAGTLVNVTVTLVCPPVTAVVIGGHDVGAAAVQQMRDDGRDVLRQASWCIGSGRSRFWQAEVDDHLSVLSAVVVRGGLCRARALRRWGDVLVGRAGAAAAQDEDKCQAGNPTAGRRFQQVHRRHLSHPSPCSRFRQAAPAKQ